MIIPRLKLSDRITWAVLLWIFLNLLWLRFLENLIPLWVGTIILTAAAVAFVLFGPRPAEMLDDDEEQTVAAQGKGR
jgi:hypothetical protein